LGFSCRRRAAESRSARTMADAWRAGGGGEIRRVRIAVGVLSVGALAALVAVSAPSDVRSSLLSWGPPSLRPVSGAALREEPGPFVWGPPHMRPARAQQAQQAAAGGRGRGQLRQRSGVPAVLVEVNQDHDEGDRIAPVNINIELPGGTAGARAAAAQPRLAAQAPPPPPSAAAPTSASPRRAEQAEPRPAAGLSSKAAVDEIDADGDAPRAASAAVFSPEASGAAAANADAEGDDPDAQEREAAAVFSPEGSGASEAARDSSGAPKLPAMWLVGSPGQPHPVHDGSAKGNPSAHQRGGKHAHAATARAHAAARVQALRMSQLSQLASRELRAAHMQPAANGAVVVPLPELETMSGRQLVALEQGLQFEERDARDSALSLRGLDRAKLLSTQIELVRKRMAKLPVEIETELAQSEEQIAKKQREVQVLQGDIADERQKVEAARKEEGPRKLRREERAMQEKVELERAVAGAVADLKGTQTPTFSKLHVPPGSDADDADPLPSISAEEDEVKAESADLAKANAELATLQAKRRELLKDMEAIHKALGSDAASDAFGDGVGGEQWLKAAGGAELAAPARPTMLAEKAEDGQGDMMHNVSEAWNDYMDATDPSHLNPGDVRHSLGRGITGGIKDAGKSMDEFAAGHWHDPKFETVNPVHGAHKVATPAAVKKLATKHVGQEGPKLQFCQWGSELVPCAPGYGGAWIEDHPQDAGIWTPFHQPAKPKVCMYVCMYVCICLSVYLSVCLSVCPFV